MTTRDKMLLLALAASIAAAFTAPGMIAQTARVIAYLLAFWTAIRFLRRHIRGFIWRLRNRLLVVYGFIGLLPVLLIFAVAALLLYASIGQLAIFLVTGEFEKRTALIVAAATHLAESETPGSGKAFTQSFPILAGRLPGIRLLMEGSQTFRYPEDATIESPKKEWGDAGGLVVKDGLLYAWAYISRPQRRVTAMMPLTPTFLASLAPNIGEISFTPLEANAGRASRRLRLHRAVAAEDADSPRNRLPPRVNWLDVEVLWGTAYPAFQWETPGVVENELMRIRTRPYAVLNSVFAQKVDVWQELIPVLLVVLFGAFLITEAASLVIGISITKSITAAVHHLYEGTERVREGDFAHRIPVQGRDQLASLGASFNTMTSEMERLLVVAKEKQRLQTELEIASEVQAQLYPRTMPDCARLRLTALCNPARMVSGDYYDCQRIDSRQVVIAIGDVAGKGISAALLMATVQSALRTEIRGQLAMRSSLSPSQLVGQLNQHLYAHTTPEKYATFCMGIYEEEQGIFHYTNAGHLPPILIRGEQSEILDVNGTVVGAFPFSRYEESSIRLDPGDLLLFYTDGITEAENAYGEQFGEERLREFAIRNRDRDSDEILHLLTGSVREWTGAGELQDDMTLLLLRRV
ncbi:MAG: SpoIIE family protein phosphatase [Candidatus Solibacter usitatus]|nr:SpoIIE family protein phosphatase [Candidatus Solibacter usitatus]